MHLCIAGSIRAMPEKEKPPAMPVDIYFAERVCKINSRRRFTASGVYARPVNITQKICFLVSFFPEMWYNTKYRFFFH